MKGLITVWQQHYINTKDGRELVQGLFVPFACVGSGDPVRSYVYSTTNTLDTIEAFIAETMYNLSLPNLMYYSTGRLCPCNCSACCRGQCSSEQMTEHHTVLYGTLNSCLCRH